MKKILIAKTRFGLKSNFSVVDASGAQFASSSMNFQGIGLSRGQISIWPLTLKKKRPEGLIRMVLIVRSTFCALCPCA